MRWRALFLFVLAVVAILLPELAEAKAYQRIMLLPGSVTLGGGGSGELPSRCLDEFGATPARGLSYGSALIGSTQTQIQFGDETAIPLQQAIDQGKIILEGRGDSYTKMSVRNLTNKPAKITTSGLTVIAPDGSYPSADLASVSAALEAHKPQVAKAPSQQELDALPPALRPQLLKRLQDAADEADNNRIWRLRKDAAAQSFSEDQRERLNELSISPLQASYYDSLVAQRQTFLLVRSDDAGRGPIHAMFFGNGKPSVSKPYEPVTQMYSEAARQWKQVVPDKPISVAVTHRVTYSHAREVANTLNAPSVLGPTTRQFFNHEFDKTYLLIAAAAAGAGGGGGNGNIIITNPADFPEPPKGWEPIPLNDNNGQQLIGPPRPPGSPPTAPTSANAAVLFLADSSPRRYEYSETFKRGEVRASAVQQQVIAPVGAAIHDVLTSNEAETLPREDLIAKLTARIRNALDPLYRSSPSSKQTELPGVRLRTRVDGVTGEQVIAIVPIKTRHAQKSDGPSE